MNPVPKKACWRRTSQGDDIPPFPPAVFLCLGRVYAPGGDKLRGTRRLEEHTSELQSLMRISYAVFCLKKKKKHIQTIDIRYSLKRVLSMHNTNRIVTIHINNTHI